MKEEYPLNMSFLRFKDSFTLGAAVLIFYEIYPTKSFAFVLDQYIDNMITSNEDPVRSFNKKWIEKSFAKEEQICRKLSELVEDKLTDRDFIRSFDIHGICDYLLNRWKKGSRFHDEFIDLSNRKTLERADFRYLLCEIGIEVPNFFVDDGSPSIIGVLPYDAKEIPHTNTSETETSTDNKKEPSYKWDIRISFKRIVQHATYTIYRTRKETDLSTEREDVLKHPFMQKILKAIREHANTDEEQLEYGDNHDPKHILKYNFPKNDRTVPEEWIDEELKKF
ncbi:MAG: hypothetical protein ACI8RA_001368 [Chlamydiales bacterium]|jgi:hypothetical protein